MVLPSKNTWIRIGAACGLLAVALGAFGAHGLKPILLENGNLATFETAARYHLIHAVAMLLPVAYRDRALCAAHFFLLGLVFFSGSLYVLAITDTKWLGAVAPIGGLSFIAGWAWIFLKGGVAED